MRREPNASDVTTGTQVMQEETPECNYLERTLGQGDLVTTTAEQDRDEADQNVWSAYTMKITRSKASK